MKLRQRFTLSVASTAFAMMMCSDGFAAPPSAAQMQAVHDCTVKQGVTLPSPPSAGPSSGKDGGTRPHQPPQLTDAQKSAIDNCFKANGFEPPQRRFPPVDND